MLNVELEKTTKHQGNFFEDKNFMVFGRLWLDCRFG